VYLAVVGPGLAVITSCSPTATEPAPTAGVPRTPGGGQPAPPPSPHPSILVGTWRGVVTSFLPNTVQTITWRFDADGACLETFLTITDGIENSSDRPCTWTADATRITVSYAGVGGPVTFSMQYSLPSLNVLRLDADEFGRVS
jgi:hypothetical protein